jgi:predicted phage terminase large subunit-like protein
MLDAESCAQEFIARKQVRTSLDRWCEFNGYKPARHHRLLNRKLEAVARGEIPRLAIFWPPGSAKSTYTSVLFPPWLLCQDPKALILAASHTTELAERWGRRVRNIIADQSLTLGIKLSDDNQAANRWSIESGGEYYAAGANVGIAGFRALYGLIDDPIRSRQDADSLLVRERLWEWYLNDFRPRLVPNARQVLIQCMTGDTRISLADGRTMRLDVIYPGDRVLSWDGRQCVAAKVSAVIDNGLDQTYLIRTKGMKVRANARHPFLVLTKDGMQWIRTINLKPGMHIIRFAAAHGEALLVPSMDAIDRQDVGVCATATTINQNGLSAIARLRSRLNTDYSGAASGVMELISRISNDFSPNRMASAPFAEPMAVAAGRVIGSQTSFPTIITKQASFAACYATTATELPDELAIPEFWNVPSNTSEADTDVVVSVTPYAMEHVFDLSIDGTHNFVANGLWCHNTRWHEDDLAGRVLNHEPWEVLSLPALAKPDDALGRRVDEPLWCDDDYGYGAQLLGLRDTTPPRVWSALYQQSPAPDEGDFFKEEWLKPRDILPHPSTLRVYGGSDYAVTSDGGDYTVHAVVGIDHLNNMYLLDVWRRQATSDIWVDAFCDLILKYRPLEWAEEGGQIKSGVGPFLEKRMRTRRLYVNRRAFTSRGDKAVRARSMQGRMALDGLYYPKHAHWVPDFLAEILSFPAAKHDDQVDALGLCGQLLDIMVIGKLKTKPTPQLPDDGYRDKKLKTVDVMTL